MAIPVVSIMQLLAMVSYFWRSGQIAGGCGDQSCYMAIMILNVASWRIFYGQTFNSNIYSGGAKRYTKGEGFSSLQGFTSLRLLLTNTKVPRSTAVLVAGVGAKAKSLPLIMTPIMDSVQAISDECTHLFEKHARGEASKPEILERIEVSIAL